MISTGYRYLGRPVASYNTPRSSWLIPPSIKGWSENGEPTATPWIAAYSRGVGGLTLFAETAAATLKRSATGAALTWSMSSTLNQKGCALQVVAPRLTDEAQAKGSRP